MDMNKLELNIFEDKSALKSISWIQMIALIVTLISMYVLEIFVIHPTGSALIGREQFGIVGAVFFIIALFFIIVIIHEAIHGLFFKVFNPKGKVKFGFKAGMAYATSPGHVYKRGQFFIIIIMPFVILTAVMLFMMFTMPNPAYKYYIALHTAACAGDFYYLYLILKHRNLAYAVDTEVGMGLYETKEEAI